MNVRPRTFTECGSRALRGRRDGLCLDYARGAVRDDDWSNRRRVCLISGVPRGRAGDGRRVRIALERTQTWVRTRVRPDPRDHPELRQTEPVGAVVPRFVPAVQSELAPRAPTPWTSRYARRAADTAVACLPSAPRVTAAMPTARRRAGRPLAAVRYRLPARDISGVPRGRLGPSRPAARLPQPPPRDGSIFHRTPASDQNHRPCRCGSAARAHALRGLRAERAGGSSRCGSPASAG